MTRQESTVGARVRGLRHQRDWTQEVLAQKATLKQSTVSRVESGHEPGAEVLRKLASALGTSTDYLVGAVSLAGLRDDVAARPSVAAVHAALAEALNLIPKGALAGTVDGASVFSVGGPLPPVLVIVAGPSTITGPGSGEGLPREEGKPR
ncbi:MAG: helix-turn-helix domain-containing protein [bacterium]